jgi:hypothetical protein
VLVSAASIATDRAECANECVFMFYCIPVE